MLEINAPLVVLTVSAMVAVLTFYPRAPRWLGVALALVTILVCLSFFFWKIRVPAGPALEIAIIAAVAALVLFNIAILVIWSRRGFRSFRP
jgi:hypothetical protein